MSLATEDSVPLTPDLPPIIPPNQPPPTYTPPVVQSHNPIGLYGWRKRCLYLLFVLLVAVMVVNLGLTVWILVVLDFNTNGMGNMEITKSGIRLEGPAEFLGPLYAQSISTDQGSPLELLSEESVNMRISNGSSLHLTSSTLNISAEELSVSLQSSTNPVLAVSEEGLSVETARMEVKGPLGATIRGPLETNQIQSSANQNLQIQSLSGVLQLTGGRGIQLQGGAGLEDVAVTSEGDLVMSSQSGRVVINGEDIQLQGVPYSMESDVYQVCVCGQGATLYLVPATSNCQEDNGRCTV